MAESRYPPAEEGVFRISNSTIESFLKCGMRWQFEQASSHRRATVPMVVGTAISAAAHYDNVAKMEGLPEQRSLDTLVDVARERYRSEVDITEVRASASEVRTGEDDATSGALGYALLISPNIIDPIMSEEPIAARIAEGIELVGTPDCITQDGVIRDTKTGQPWTQERADRARQLTGYDLLHEARCGSPARRVAIDSLSRRGVAWDATTIWSSRTEADRVAYVDLVILVKAAMESGVVLPAPEGAWWCSERWCAYWDECPFAPQRNR